MRLASEFFVKIVRVLLVSALLLLVSSSTAWAKSSAELIRQVPGSSPLIVGVEMGKVKSTQLFKEGLAFVTRVAKGESLLDFVLSKKAFDFEKDINAVLVAFATAPTNPQAPPPPAMAVVDGTFDPARVKAAIEARYGKTQSRTVGSMEVMSTAGVEFAFVDATTLVITESRYAPPTWKAVADENASALKNASIVGLMALTDTTRGIWFAMSTASIATPAGTPQMDGAGISLDLRSGLAVDFRSQFAKAADAVAAKNQADEIKKNTDDALLEMLGAKPLVENLVATIHNERVVALTTTMKDAEVRVMLQRLKAMNEAPPPVAPSGKQPTTTTGASPAPTQPGHGTKADFN